VPTHQVAGMGRAFAIAAEHMVAEAARIGALRERLWAALATLPDLKLNGHPLRRVPGILSVTVDGVEGESLLQSLPDFAIASGSACASTSAEPSYVLRALGRSDRLAQSTLRLSLGRFTTAEHVEYAGRRVREEIERLRAIAPHGVGVRPR